MRTNPDGVIRVINEAVMGDKPATGTALIQALAPEALPTARPSAPTITFTAAPSQPPYQPATVLQPQPRYLAPYGTILGPSGDTCKARASRRDEEQRWRGGGEEETRSLAPLSRGSCF